MKRNAILPFGVMVLVAQCLGIGAGGCCAIDRFRPANEREIAARELARLGLDAMDRGQFADAEARFACALEKSPKNPEARHHLALLRWQQGQGAVAIQEMETAIRHSGGDPQWTIELGQMLLTIGDHPAALKHSEIALEADPQSQTAWKLRGDIHHQSQQWTQAKEAYHRVLSADPYHVDALVSLAEIYQLEGNPLRALATLQRLESSLPSTEQWPEDLSYRQGLAQQALGRHTAAAECFAAARRRMGEQPEVLLHLAECQLLLGQIDAARQTAHAAAQIGVSDVRWDEVHRQLGQGSVRVAASP